MKNFITSPCFLSRFQKLMLYPHYHHYSSTISVWVAILLTEGTGVRRMHCGISDTNLLMMYGSWFNDRSDFYKYMA